MTVLTVLPSVCTHYGHPLSFLQQNQARKLKQDLQTTSAIMHCRRDFALLKHSAGSLVWQQLLLLTKQKPLQDQSSPNMMAPNHHFTFGAIGPKLHYQRPPLHGWAQYWISKFGPQAATQITQHHTRIKAVLFVLSKIGLILISQNAMT